MNRHLSILQKGIWVVLMAGVLMACGEQSPPSAQPKAVSKKIAVQQAKPAAGPELPTPAPTPPSSATAPATPAPVGTASSPTPAATPGASPAPAATSTPGQKSQEVEKAVPPTGAASPAPAATMPMAAPAATPAPTPAPTPTPGAGAGDTPSLVKESMQMAASYDPEGRFDPFEPLFKEQQSQNMSSSQGKRNKRTPQTPLEKVALAQLKVTAIIRAPSGNRALVEDATGKGYVVQVGTYMGLNSGQVTRIDNDRVVVEEENENLSGELTVQNQELKLQKPAGEL